MGKATITSAIADGEYNISIVKDNYRVDAEIARVDRQIELLTAEAATLPAGTKKDRVLLEKSGREKRKAFLEDNYPGAENVTAWCADFTDDLAVGASVGTVEVPGERRMNQTGLASREREDVNIQPGYESNAVYDSTRDGGLQDAVAGTPSSVFWNLSVLPGWQKWKPTYRYGTITAIDYDTHLCAITLESAYCHAQGLDVNQTETLSDVLFEYMQCDDAAFEVDDVVLIKFEEQDWANPVVVGFKKEPNPCAYRFKLTTADGEIITKDTYPKLNNIIHTTPEDWDYEIDEETDIIYFKVATKSSFGSYVNRPFEATYDTETEIWSFWYLFESQIDDDGCYPQFNYSQSESLAGNTLTTSYDGYSGVLGEDDLLQPRYYELQLELFSGSYAYYINDVLVDAEFNDLGLNGSISGPTPEEFLDQTIPYRTTHIPTYPGVTQRVTFYALEPGSVFKRKVTVNSTVSYSVIYEIENYAIDNGYPAGVGDSAFRTYIDMADAYFSNACGTFYPYGYPRAAPNASLSTGSPTLAIINSDGLIPGSMTMGGDEIAEDSAQANKVASGLGAGNVHSVTLTLTDEDSASAYGYFNDVLEPPGCTDYGLSAELCPAEPPIASIVHVELLGLTAVP